MAGPVMTAEAADVAGVGPEAEDAGSEAETDGGGGGGGAAASL